MKKLICALLALIMVLSCGACALAESEVYQHIHPYEQTVFVTIMGTDDKDSVTVYDTSKPDRASANENAWIDAYKNYLNIDVKRIICESNEALTVNLNTMMASQELPDVMVVTKDMFKVMVENEVLADISDAFNSYDGQLWNDIQNSYTDEIWETGKFDGKLYGIPYVQNFYNSSSCLWVRTDWLEKLNLEVPTTLDELEAVAQAFVDNKMGGEATVGIGTVKMDDSAFNYSFFADVLAAYGVPVDTWMEDEEGKLVYSSTLPSVKEGLLRLQSLYQKGLISSDFAVTSNMNPSASNGECGLLCGQPWLAVTCIQNSLLNDSEAAWTAVNIPTLDGKPVMQTTNASVDKFVVFREGFEHPDVLFRMKELESYAKTRAREGTPEHLLNITEDGYKVWNLQVFRNLERGDLDLYQSELMIKAVENGDTLENCDPFIAAAYAQVLEGLSGNRASEGAAMVFLVSDPVANNLLKAGLLKARYNGPITESMNLYESTIKASLLSAMAKVVMGDDVSVFDQAVAEWYANGGQLITDDVNANR